MKKLGKFYQENKFILNTLFLFSILIIGYFGVSTVINTDGLDDLLVYGNTYDTNLYFSVGRWGWAVICNLFNFYPSPFLYLFLNSILFSLSGLYLSKIFKIKNKYFSVIPGMLLIACPYNLVAYSYSAWQSSIGISYFLIIYSIYKLKENHDLKTLLITSLILAFTIGIYQIFICFIATLMVGISLCYVIDEKNIKKIFKRIGYYLLCVILASILYYLITKILVNITHTTMSTYQGADVMFNFSFNDMIYGFKNNIISAFLPFKEFYFFPMYVQIILLLLIIVIPCLALPKLDYKRAILFVVLLLILFIAPKFLTLVKPNEWYHEVTLLPLSIFYGTSIALLFKTVELYPKLNKIFINAIMVLLIFSISVLVIKDNNEGVMAKKASEASFAYTNRLITRIEELDDYDRLGDNISLYFTDKYSLNNFYYQTSAFPPITGISSSFIHTGDKLIVAMNVLGFKATKAILDNKTAQEIEKLTEFKSPYPSKESIFIYKGVVVIYN